MRSTTDRRALGTTHGVADDTDDIRAQSPLAPRRRPIVGQSEHLHAASIPLLATVASRMVHSSLLCALPAMLTRVTQSVLRHSSCRCHSHHTDATALPDPVAWMPQGM